LLPRARPRHARSDLPSPREPLGRVYSLPFLEPRRAQSRRGLSGARHADGGGAHDASRRRREAARSRFRDDARALSADRRGLRLRWPHLLLSLRRALGTFDRALRRPRLFPRARLRIETRGSVAEVTMQRLGRFLLLLFALAAAPAATETALAPLPVVASFSILGDFLREVGGDEVAVSVIVGPKSDAHVYEPTPADARKVSEARLVFVNGLGFEGWFDRLVAAADAKARVVVASAGIAPRKLDVGLDPHAWQNVANARRYVENIRDALKAADPERAALYESRAAAYLATLEALDKEVAAAIAAIPSQRRRIVSTHDAFGYFAA